MLLHIRQVLTPDGLHQAQALLQHAPWADGRATAGVQSAQAKHNSQLPQDCAEAKALQQLVLTGLTRHAARLASFFWIERMVRSDAQRRLLFDMDGHLMQLRRSVGEQDPAVIGLSGTHHNLLRQWADV